MEKCTIQTYENQEASKQHVSQQLPPWFVILVNDDTNHAENVARRVWELTPLDKMASLDKTIEAHNKGRAFLLTTHKERAELYRDQFRSHVPPITVDIEPV